MVAMGAGGQGCPTFFMKNMEYVIYVPYEDNDDTDVGEGTI